MVYLPQIWMIIECVRVLYCLSSPEVDIGRSEVVEALVIADVVIVRDEGVDLPFEITGQNVEQDAALQVLVPTLDLALGLRVIRRPTHMLHTLILKPLGQIACACRKSNPNILVV